MKAHRIIYVPGTFDLFHQGHLDLLITARDIVGEHGIVIAGVNSDELIKSRGGVVVDDEIDRQKKVVMSNLADRVFIINKDNMKSLMLMAKDGFALHGDDWGASSLAAVYGVEDSWFLKNRIKLLFKERYPGVSSSDLRGSRGVK